MVLYKDAGVDIDAANTVKKRIKQLVKKTFSANVLSEIGLFGSLYQLTGYKKPVLVASCDGVGTKLLIAVMMNKHDTVGEDLVNHCVNDILTLGAKPLFFLDYIAYSQLAPATIQAVFKGLVRGCHNNNCALIGGETAQMPGFYKPGEYDLVGFIVGVVEKKKIIDSKKLSAGDILIGLPSSGLHTNGYSLARKIFFEIKKLQPNDKIKGLKNSIGTELLKVHRSYYPKLYPLLEEIKALAHITGGGFFENIKRLLPKNIACVINKNAWRVPKIFQLIQEYGNLPDSEMYRVFNMGIGMVVFVNRKLAAKILKKLNDGIVIGELIKGDFGVRIE
ncbi:MAG: phosphoribosylformylglycinamidine cyclo-ligase [candidate division WOR-3 bacterium]